MLYWNSRSIPELNELNFRDRMSVLRRATDQLPTPKKLVLNLLKLVVLIPLFLAIARSGSLLEGFGWCVLLILLYPLATRPVTFAFTQPLLRQARYQFEQQKGNE